MDGGAWWAAVHGIVKIWTRLSDFTFTFHFHAWEGNGNPLQCSCLENPWDGGAWWAAVYGVAQSWTWLKRLSSSSSSSSRWRAWVFSTEESFRLALSLCSHHSESGGGTFFAILINYDEDFGRQYVPGFQVCDFADSPASCPERWFFLFPSIQFPAALSFLILSSE